MKSIITTPTAADQVNFKNDKEDLPSLLKMNDSSSRHNDKLDIVSNLIP